VLPFFGRSKNALHTVRRQARLFCCFGLLSGKGLLMAELLEATMLVCFGLSWPLNAYKAFRAATAKSTSWPFLALISFGYIAGIASKFASGTINWVLAVYFINLACLGINWLAYVRNRRIDAAAKRAAGA
jgi:hypothetical protein